MNSKKIKILGKIVPNKKLGNKVVWNLSPADKSVLKYCRRKIKEGSEVHQRIIDLILYKNDKFKKSGSGKTTFKKRKN